MSADTPPNDDAPAPPQTLEEHLAAADHNLLLEILPTVRVAQLALLEPRNEAMRTEALEQIAELLAALRKRLRITK